MLSMYAIKPFYQKLFRGLAGEWMSPDMATGFGVLFAFAVGAGWILGARVSPLWFLLVPVGLIFRMGANALDGMLAREKGLASPLGAVLNEVTDVVNDVISYLPLWFVPGVRPLVLTAFLLIVFFAEFSGLLGQAVTGQRRYEGPLGGKTDRATLMGAFALAAAFSPAVARHASLFLAVLCVPVLATAFNRLRLIVAEA